MDNINTDTNKLYMVASVNNEKQCNYVAPFHYNDIEAEYNTSLGKVNTPEDINTIKQAFLKINNTANGAITQCCNPELDETHVTTELLTQYRNKFPAVRDIIKNGILDAIEVSTIAQNMEKQNNGWKVLSPYYLCKLSKSELKPTGTPNVFRTVTLLTDCYSKACSADTVTLEHLFNSTRVDTSYTYYDDAKVAQSIQEGDAVGLEKYLRKYNKVNVYLTHDDYENTLLHLAARNKSTPKILAMLLAVKPNLEVRNAEGDKPIHVACRYGNMTVIEQLVKLGAEINPKNNKGETPIMLAVGYSSNSNSMDNEMSGMILRYLYNNGANLFDQDNKGNTILHHIIKHAPDTPEKTKLVRFVIDHGVSAETQNTAGLTALELTADLLDKLIPTTTKAPGSKPVVTQSPYFTEPVIPYKKNSPFPIKQINYDTLGLDNNGMNNRMNNRKPSTNIMNSSNIYNTTTTKYMPGNNINSSNMQRFKKWLSSTSPTATISSLIMEPSLTKAATATTTTTTTTTVPTQTQSFNDTRKEGFQVDKQNYDAMSIREKELLQIQTLLFNDILKSNPDKYDKYINVSEVPHGAPIEILDYMCTGGNESVTGSEDRETCEAMGGQFVKIKNPTTLVKLELLPESERMIAAEDEDELYYPKYPESMPERPLPTIESEPVTTQKATQKATKGNRPTTTTKSNITTNEMFTDFSDTYKSRDDSILQPFNPNELASGGNLTDSMQIYNQVPNFNQNMGGNNLVKPNMRIVDLEHPKIPNGHYLVQETVKAGINAERITSDEGGHIIKKVKILTSNMPLFITLILLFIMLGMVMYIWLQK